MFGQVKELLFTEMGKDTAIVFGGTLINVTFGGLFFIFVPRILGPSDYGIFATVAATGVMVSSFANFGIDTGILRFVKHTDKDKSNQILKLAFQSVLFMGIATFAVGFLMSQSIAGLLGHPDIFPLLRIAFAGIILLVLTEFFVAILQSRRQFLKASIVSSSSNLARFAILIIALYLFSVDLYFLTALFFFVTIISVVIGKLFVPLDFLKAKNHVIHFKEFFTFNFWVVASRAISSIPFDNYLLLRFAGPISTGLYAAPYKILSGVDQFAGNFSSVLAPRLTSLENNKQVKEFIKKTIPIIVPFILFIFLSILIAKPLINVIFGSEYSGSIPVFQIIAISSAIAVAEIIPVSIVIYYFGKPKVAFIITSLLMVVWIISSVILIPPFKEVGAAFANLISEIFVFSMFTGYVIWKFVKKNRNDQD